MKRKAKMLLAALSAVLMLGTAVTAPVCAAETEKHYVLGDVNMDGTVGLEDAAIALQEYTNIFLFQKEERILTGEKYALAKISADDYNDVHITDALDILIFYTKRELFSEKVNWKTLWGEEYFSAHIAAIDRGDYTLAFDEAVGDYVIVKKG